MLVETYLHAPPPRGYSSFVVIVGAANNQCRRRGITPPSRR